MKEVGIPSQRELAKRSGIDPGTLANITSGRVTGYPSRATLKKLAKGLSVPSSTVTADDLFGVGEGHEPVPSTQGPGHTLLGLLNEFGQVEYPPTPQEQAIYDESMRLGFPGWPTLSEPGFWSRPPEDRLRRSTFRNIEAAVDDAKAFYGENGG